MGIHRSYPSPSKQNQNKNENPNFSPRPSEFKRQSFHRIVCKRIRGGREKTKPNSEKLREHSKKKRRKRREFGGVDWPELRRRRRPWNRTTSSAWSPSGAAKSFLGSHVAAVLFLSSIERLFIRVRIKPSQIPKTTSPCGSSIHHANGNLRFDSKTEEFWCDV